METSVKYKVKSKGLNTTDKHPPVSAKLSPKIDKIVRSLPNRSDFIRAAIAEKLEREGLLSETTFSN